MKVSIVHPVLNSHEIVRRQLLHYDKILSSDVEVILVDDGSDPPIKGDCKNLRIIRTHDTRKWTEHKARNIGARAAAGEYFFLIDIDYIIPKDTISKSLEFSGDRMGIRRRFGVLDENGKIADDDKTLVDWGLKKRWVRKKKFPGHRSQFLIHKKVFWKMGGYNAKLDGKWRRTGGAGEKFWRLWQRLEAAGDVKEAEEKLDVFMFPSGKYCEVKPNMFSGLSQE